MAAATNPSPSARLHEVYDPTRRGVVFTGSSSRCAEYVARLSATRRKAAVVRVAGR